MNICLEFGVFQSFKVVYFKLKTVMEGKTFGLLSKREIVLAGGSSPVRFALLHKNVTFFHMLLPLCQLHYSLSACE
jgi:hypothetical protein